MIPPRKDHQSEHSESWLMSYADMITLLMCFFIIFISVSAPQNDKFSEITKGLASKFGSVDMSTPFQGVFQSLQAVVESNQVFHDVSIEKSERSISMELASNSFFKKNSADFDEKKLQLLSEMIDAFNKIDYMDYRITIESYTNDIPVNTPLFPSNWELSSARSAHMVRFLISHGVEANRLKAVGYGDSRPKVPNIDIDGSPITENREKNERLVIRLERVL